MSKNVILLLIFLLFFIKCNPQIRNNGPPGKQEKKENNNPPPDNLDNNHNDRPNEKNNNEPRLNKIDELEKKKENIIKEIFNSKAKLKKYNIIYNIIEIVNIIFALIISSYFVSNLYEFIRKKKNQSNSSFDVSINDINIDNREAPPSSGD